MKTDEQRIKLKRCVKSGRKPERRRLRMIELLSFLSILKIDIDLHMKHTALLQI